jgi:hypothetical protein
VIYCCTRFLLNELKNDDKRAMKNSKKKTLCWFECNFNIVLVYIQMQTIEVDFILTFLYTSRESKNVNLKDY